LGCPSLARKPHFGIAEPLLTRVSKEVQVTGPEEWVDDSPVPGSVEFFDPMRIVQYLRMPETVNGLEKHLEEIAQQMKVFGERMKEHMKLISTLQELAESLKEAADSLLKSSTWFNRKD